MKHLFTVVFILVSLVCEAQLSNVQIIDLFARPVPTIHADTSEIDTMQTRIMIGFKIKNIAEASKAHILIGTIAGGSNTANIAADFIYQNNSYFLSYNAILFPVIGYEASIQLNVNSGQFQNYRYVTVSVEDNNNIETQKIKARLY